MKFAVVLSTVVLSAVALFASASALNFTFDGFEAQIVEKPVSGMGVMSHLNDRCYFSPYTDIVGLDVGSAQTAQTNCCQLCKLNDECHAYTWTSYNGGTCWFKKTLGRVVVNEGAVSSALGGMQVEAVVSRCDMPGNDIGTASSSRFQSCAIACNNNPACRAVTWTNYNGGTCWLKSRVANCVESAGASTYVFFR